MPHSPLRFIQSDGCAIVLASHAQFLSITERPDGGTTVLVNLGLAHGIQREDPVSYNLKQTVEEVEKVLLARVQMAVQLAAMQTAKRDAARAAALHSGPRGRHYAHGTLPPGVTPVEQRWPPSPDEGDFFSAGGVEPLLTPAKPAFDVEDLDLMSGLPATGESYLG